MAATVAENSDAASITSKVAEKHKLGQYFTTNIELKKKVFEFVLNNPSNILEPSVGQGDLVSTRYQIQHSICMKLIQILNY